ncbi:MAG: ATP-binding protein [Planctomycetes bacterium]|nr:ATP-binding protein [Planctomycetota bacterium]
MINLQVEVPDAPVIANVDRTQIRQLLYNLILNSIDALKNRGTIHVQLDPNALLPAQAIANESPSSLADTEDLISEHQALRIGARKNITNPRPCFMIRVSDNGVGIPAEMLDRIFEPFVTSKETGTGLGLSICKRIADMHRGLLVAANRVGGGAEFSFYLPQDTTVPKSTPD